MDGLSMAAPTDDKSDVTAFCHHFSFYIYDSKFLAEG